MNIHTFDDITNPPPQKVTTSMQPQNLNETSSTSVISPGNFKIKSFYFSIIIINCTIYLIELALFYIIYRKTHWSCILFLLGAKETPAICYNKQIWRFITPIILHGSLLHLITNTLSICFIVVYIENKIGWLKTALLYFFAGFIGNLISAVTNVSGIGVGASGSIMGCTGLLMVYYILNYHKMNFNEKKFFIYFAGITLINLFSNQMGKDGNKVDNFAHIGGFISGIALGLFLLEKWIDYAYYPVNLVRKLKLIFIICFGIMFAGCVMYLIIRKDWGGSLIGVCRY